MAVQKCTKLMVFALDCYHDNYDWATADNPVDLPVILLEYSKTETSVRWVSKEFRFRVNRHVAEQHRLHGWQAFPPYFEDQSRTRNGHPSYRNPRDLFPRPPQNTACSSNGTGRGADASC
ncbi:hypothetical protein FHL15_011322 [Xylaria flabelliformis]|uniref:Uncharacterized protein n=1 Tax=Xylaria flabelliformis TaxID=2512241 RepID=A0A553HIL6_9PEZI|nr:hypothetical protein FHL15_011322 [Xylaria flabelliformis]